MSWHASSILQLSNNTIGGALICVDGKFRDCQVNHDSYENHSTIAIQHII